MRGKWGALQRYLSSFVPPDISNLGLYSGSGWGGKENTSTRDPWEASELGVQWQSSNHPQSRMFVKFFPLSQCQPLATDFFLDPMPLFLLSLLWDVPATFLPLSSQLRLTPAGLNTLNPKG